MDDAKQYGPYIGIGVACLFVAICFVVLTRHICLTKCIPYYRRWKVLQNQQKRRDNYRLPPLSNMPRNQEFDEIQPRRSEQPRKTQRKNSQHRIQELQPRRSEPIRMNTINNNIQIQEELLIEIYLQNEIVDQVIAMSQYEDQMKQKVTMKKKKKKTVRRSVTNKERSKKEQVLKDNQCYICFNNKMDRQFNPCHHRICSDCGPLLTKCPLCRQDIISIT